MGEHGKLAGVRTRWAAIGAAVAVVLGAGGIAVSGATNAQLTPSETVITPCRIMDTRASSQVGPRSTPLGTDTTHTIQVTGKNGNCSIPADASSVTMNVTLVNPALPGFITVFPADVARPTASNLNYVAGQAPTPNLVKAGLSADGRVSFFARFGPVDLIADIVSFSTGARLSTADIAQQRWDKDLAKPATVSVGDGPTGIASDGTNIWVTNNLADTVSKINPATNTVTATVPVGDGPTGIASDGTNVWVTNNLADTISKINPATNTVTATIPVGDGPQAMTFDGTNIWVTNGNGSTISKVSPTTNTVTATVTVGAGPRGITFDGTQLWVVGAGIGGRFISRVDPTTDTVLSSGDPLVTPSGITFDGTNIWIANASDNTITVLNGLTGGASTIRVSAGLLGESMTFDGTNIWVISVNAGSISKINPTSNAVTGPFPFARSGNLTGIAFDGTNIWVTGFLTDTVSKVRVG